MRKWITVVAAVALALVFSLALRVSERTGRREGYRAGLHDGADVKEAEMLRSFDDVRQVAVDSLRRESECEFGKPAASH